MKSVFVDKRIIDKALKTIPKKGKNSIEPFKTWSVKKNLPFSILENNEVLNKAERHRNEGDLWFCLEGKVNFICGGKMINEVIVNKTKRLESQGDSIKNGFKITLNKGDWLWIPAGEPHQHSSKNLSRLLIIKIPQKSS